MELLDTASFVFPDYRRGGSIIQVSLRFELYRRHRLLGDKYEVHIMETGYPDIKTIIYDIRDYQKMLFKALCQQYSREYEHDYYPYLRDEQTFRIFNTQLSCDSLEYDHSNGKLSCRLSYHLPYVKGFSEYFMNNYHVAVPESGLCYWILTEKEASLFSNGKKLFTYYNPNSFLILAARCLPHWNGPSGPYPNY